MANANANPPTSNIVASSTSIKVKPALRERLMARCPACWPPPAATCAIAASDWAARPNVPPRSIAADGARRATSAPAGCAAVRRRGALPSTSESGRFRTCRVAARAPAACRCPARPAAIARARWRACFHRPRAPGVQHRTTTRATGSTPTPAMRRQRSLRSGCNRADASWRRRPQWARAHLAGDPTHVHAPSGVLDLQIDTPAGRSAIRKELDRALILPRLHLARAGEAHFQRRRQIAMMAAGCFPAPLLRVDQKPLRRAGGNRLGARVAQLRGDRLAGSAQAHAVDAAVQCGSGKYAGQCDQRDHQQHLQQRGATRACPTRADHSMPMTQRLTRNAHGERLLVLDVRVVTAAAGLAVLAQADQIERLTVAGRTVFDGVAPWVVEFGRLDVRAQPTAAVAGLGDQVIEFARQLAGVELEILDLAGQRLDLRLGQIGLAAIGTAKHATADQREHRTDQHDDDDDFQQAHAGLACARRTAGDGTLDHERFPCTSMRDAAANR
ncbi:hypothetical protein XAC2852_730025 [Xanthomonas citri pv. citri]|nr:hypothetical protein XAC2852_730025 [Xanthomonas citri pv. citri]